MSLDIDPIQTDGLHSELRGNVSIEESGTPELGQLRVTLAIIARNEAGHIGRTIASLAEQDLFARPGPAPDLVVLANGCSDNTIEVAREAVAQRMAGKLRRAELVDTPVGGKSRAWNRVVHELAAPDTDLFLFLDADIELAGADVCRHLIEQLVNDGHAVACTGHPVKRIARKARKSLVERMSLDVSEASRVDRAINGSLYCAYASALRPIWLPEPTPGEDGFLNAMIHTRGFSAPMDRNLVTQLERVTHFYEPAPLNRIVAHEQRMVIGTAVNIWLFEHFMAMDPSEPVGPLIGRRNAGHPGWVGAVVRERTGSRAWVVPRALLFWRMPKVSPRQPLASLRRLPLGLAATAFSFVVALLANRRLKQEGAAGYW